MSSILSIKLIATLDIFVKDNFQGTLYHFWVFIKTVTHSISGHLKCWPTFGVPPHRSKKSVPEVGKLNINKGRGTIPRGHLIERRRKKKSERCIPKVRGSFWESSHRGDQRIGGVLSPRKRMREICHKSSRTW